MRYNQFWGPVIFRFFNFLQKPKQRKVTWNNKPIGLAEFVDCYFGRIRSPLDLRRGVGPLVLSGMLASGARHSFRHKPAAQPL